MMKLPYRLVFFGTPEFAVPILESLATAAQVVLVVSQPDKPSGRGCKMCKPPVKVSAEKLGIEVIQPEVAKGKRFAERIAAVVPDFLITAAYGKILGKSVLAVPKKSALNVHASLLPRYRGAAPAAWAVLNGDEETGVCIMQMDPELDAGPVYYKVITAIEENETAGELLARLSVIGAEAVVEALRRFDNLSPAPQDHRAATYARMLAKQDGQIDWTKDARTIHNHVRGMSPWPTAFTSCSAEVVKIHSTVLVDDHVAAGAPGEVICVSKEGIDVVCGTGLLRIAALQVPGKNRMPVHAFIQGNPLCVGTILGAVMEGS